ncbi:MAG TPA: dihydrodipicolinate synthase family protein [Candidatus Limiplasma sp.]|nr:dihydrodipicolinate synthase family protein [Candidatus Limiplasma sp.]
MKQLRGAIGVTVTPFDRDWQVDLQVVRTQAERLSDSRITGVFPCASTGEFPHLSFAQQRAIYIATKEGIGNDKTLIAGACTPNLRQSIACARLAGELRYNACVACPPYYYPHTQEEIFAFYQELAKASPVPVILYHVPFFTSGIAMDTVSKLMRIPNIVGIKDSSADMKRISHLCQLHTQREDFLIYTGTDDCLLPALAAGVDGNMTAFAASVPDWVTDIYQAFGEGKLAQAAAYQRRMMPLLAVADALPFPLGYKLVAQAHYQLPMTQRVHQLAPEETVEIAQQKIEKLLRA